ncbi:putative glycerophosphocholine phosphodiesterase GPCPD1 T05H10.7 [Paragonimus heterotremus]|uniref:Putative glycerophosphocholine phosphodiesterase GPCPD1 T05H10.7 n=1 Tax=Paragonimus heterotremus TaxID=100268 RepID=A0A8J4WI16_9TREM|nr:putative glycerophosphocholine phosphodiesterase GPCPD1 T05H10.7 [Paragonimus heterotremus]
MRSEGCHLTISLTVEIDFKSLEDVGTYVDNASANPDQKFVVGITGDVSDLGNWNPEKGVICKFLCSQSDGLEIWQCQFTSSIRHSIRYRYFVAEIKENNDEYSDSNMLRILAWESRLKPRTFSLIDYLNAENKESLTHAVFGVYDDGTFIQRGWLTSNSELHVQLSGSACKFFSCCFPNTVQSQYRLYIACSKYVVQPTCGENFDVDTVCDCTIVKTEDTIEQPVDPESLEPHKFKLRRPSAPLSTGSFSFAPHGRSQPVLLSTLEINRCRMHRGENKECWGTLYKPGDDVTFYVETNDVQNAAIAIEFYRQELKPTPKDVLRPDMPPLRFLGCARFGPFDGTHGRKASQILSSKQLPIGDLRIHYLVIHPMARALPPSLAVTYQHYWKKRRTVDIGHRGMGTSFFEQSKKHIKKPATTKENTLDSFRTAVQHGADFVEMDVQLTKDHRVIVYHDYEAVIISKKKRGGRLSYLPIAIKDLNYEDLRELKVHHSSVLHEEHTHEKMDEEDLDPIELQSFPLLRSCFEEVDPSLGFVIEVKYPMEYKAGGSELNNFFEYNFYVDTILREILTYAGSRRILLSCFDPNVCVMLQRKQNLYPVFQLGIAPEYADSRQAEFERLFWSALSQQLLGVCLESDRVLETPGVIQLAHLHSLVVLAWGEAVNCPEKRAQLTEMGVDGIIYDRLHENKESGTLNVFQQDGFVSSTSPVLSSPSKSDSGLASASNVEDAKAQLITASTGSVVGQPSAIAPFPPPTTKTPNGPTLVAVVKECIEVEKLPHSNSTTTCDSIPHTSMSDLIPDLQSLSVQESDATAAAINTDRTLPVKSGSPEEAVTPVLTDTTMRTRTTSSTQHAVPLITLA